MKRLLAVCLLAVLLAALAFTPLSLMGAVPDQQGAFVTVINTVPIAVNTTWGAYPWIGSADTADIFIHVDQPTLPNTVTLQLQVSPNGALWMAHPASSALLTDNVADTDVVTQVNVVGLVYRIVATVAGTTTLTPTIYSVGH